MIRVLIADDHPIVREGLKRILAETPDIRVVAETSSGDAIREALVRTGAEIILLDICMPGPGFLEVLQLLRRAHPRVRAIVLSMYPEDAYAVRAFRAGAAGYLTKDRTPENLVEAIRRVVAGRKYVSPELAERLAAGPPVAGPPAHEVLSNREHQVLLLLAAGEPGKRIGARLRLSPKTVSTYRSRVLRKLGVRTTADLVRYVIEEGLAPRSRAGAPEP